MFLGLVVSLIACSAELPNEVPREPTPPRTEEPPRTESMGAPISATVLSAGFEPASPDCNGWAAEGALSVRSVPPHAGAYACKLCADGSRSGISLSRDIVGLSAGRYVLTAWTRKRPQNEAPVRGVARLRAGGLEVATATDVRDDWSRVEATIDVPEGSDTLGVSIGADVAEADECVLIDDVAIERVD